MKHKARVFHIISLINTKQICSLDMWSRFSFGVSELMQVTKKPSLLAMRIFRNWLLISFKSIFLRIIWRCINCNASMHWSKQLRKLLNSSCGKTLCLCSWGPRYFCLVLQSSFWFCFWRKLYDYWIRICMYRRHIEAG